MWHTSGQVTLLEHLEHRTDQVSAQSGAQALLSGPSGPQRPYPPSMSPDGLRGNGPRTVNMCDGLFGIWTHLDLKMPQSVAVTGLLQGAPPLKIDQNRSPFDNITLVGTATASNSL